MRSVTQFQHLLSPLSKRHFQQRVDHHEGDKHTKGFRSRHLLVSLIYAQLTGANSLRELETSFNCHDNHFYQLGARPIKRSTVADALARRSVAPFREGCNHLLSLAHRQLRRDCRELLYLLDSSHIPLFEKAYESWTRAHASDRLRGLKLHVQLEAGQAMPVYANIDHPNVNDITDAQRLPLEKGATYAFDKGYADYNWWYAIHQRGAFFVTRLKRNAAFREERELSRPEPGSRVLRDQEIQLRHRRPGGKRVNQYANRPLRRITVHREDHQTPLILVTNDFSRCADEIAEVYRQRWGIELFFKWIKQNLKIRKFLGTSENSVRIQLYCALIAYLLVALFHRRHAIAGPLRNTLIQLANTLFVPLPHERRYQRQRYRQRRESRQQLNPQVRLL